LLTAYPLKNGAAGLFSCEKPAAHVSPHILEFKPVAAVKHYGGDNSN
jgi:hypothetical protein